MSAQKIRSDEAMSEDKKTQVVSISFDNPEAANHFLTWLCEQGEQDYWLWMEYREQEEKSGNITATSFDYNFSELSANTTCSRLDGK
jgi:hypothetical protein